MDKFEPVLNALQEAAAAAADALETDGKPKWYPLKDGKVIDGFNHSSISEAFNREKQEKDYTDAVDDAKSFRLVQAAKIESDMLAAIERDTRMRHRSRIRMLAHAAARLKTHGLAEGPSGRVIQFVNRLKEQA